ncbi:hypothetical protein, partial [Pseudomonas aeruginosa]|uniref:hypothetical protein n=1 Tax=Pseudomonas aeruginosa TaxID=287 RepID=UPI00359407BF
LHLQKLLRLFLLNVMFYRYHWLLGAVIASQWLYLGIFEMAFVCSELQLINNVQTCVSWVEQVTLLEQLAITKAQMVMLGTPIV